MRHALALVVCAAAGSAHAAITLYTDEAAYLAAVGATTTFVDFAGSPGAIVAGSSFTPAATFATCGNGFASCTPQVLHNSDAITDIGGSPAPNGVAALGGSFAVPQQAFAFHYVSGAIASVRFAGIAAPVDTTAAAGFIGIVSDLPVLAFIADNAVFPGGIGNDRYFIDDFRINAAVPEPATPALWLAGGVAAAMRLRRRLPRR